MKKIILFFATFLLVAVYQGKTTQLYAADCGQKPKITIAEMTWASASMYAYLVKQILNEGYGCKSSIVPADTVAAGASMLAKQSPSIAPEFWTSSQPKISDEIKKPNGRVFKANDSFTKGGVEGIWVPDYVYNEMGIQSVTDLEKNWKLFTEPASPKKGRFYGCPPGWGCEITSTNLFHALNLGDTYKYFSPGSGAALKASIAKRVLAKQPVVSYYWDPTDVTGRYNLVKLASPAYDSKKWECITNTECSNPQVSDYPAAEVLIVVVATLKKTAPDAVEFLGNMSIPNPIAAAILGWADETKATGEEAAVKFLNENQDIWVSWVPTDVANRVKESL